MSRLPVRPPLHPSDFPDWGAYYWEYQWRLTRDYLLPLLRRWGAWAPGCRVLDVGCGDAGGTCALAAAGADVIGIELEGAAIETAQARARERGVSPLLRPGDITRESTLDGLPTRFDLVIFRDVLEHIPDRELALAGAVRRLADGGALAIDFPPWLSPYGGHQQNLHPPRRLGLRWAKLPFAHWLPAPWHRALAAGPGGVDDPQWQELATIRRARLTLATMRAAAARHGLVVAAAEHYLLRPTFYLRYGLPVVRAGALARLPGVGEVIVTGSTQLLRRRDPRSQRLGEKLAAGAASL